MVQIPSEFYIDVGWMNGLNMAVARQMRFGRDVIFTYGPLGYLSFPFFPEADPQLVRFFFADLLYLGCVCRLATIISRGCNPAVRTCSERKRYRNIVS